MAGALGFEPRLADSESAVLPLYDAPEREEDYLLQKARCQTGENSHVISTVFFWRKADNIITIVLPSEWQIRRCARLIVKESQHLSKSFLYSSLLQNLVCQITTFYF